jgi:hypothetical protein
MPLPLWDPYHYDGRPLEALSAPQIPAVPFEKPRSIRYDASNFAILRNDRFNLFIKYGHNGPSHAHPDKMTFELTLDNAAVTRDLSNAGYGAQICNEWHRQSISHNTEVGDGGNHTNTEGGKILSFDADHIRATATPCEGLTFTREMRLAGSHVHDSFVVEGSAGHTFDYVLHIDGDVTYDAAVCSAEECQLGYTENGYQHIKNVQRLTGNVVLTAHANGIKYIILPDTDGEVLLCDTLDNPVTRYRKALIIRKRGVRAEFSLSLQAVDPI